MKIGFVIPARLKSTRLNRKILIKLGDQSALEWAIDRAKSSEGIDEVVVSTTPLFTDEEISKVCVKKGVRYFQGDPDDVLLRLKDTAKYFGFDYIVNITPDNTLFSVHLIGLLIKEIKEGSGSDFIKFKNAMLGTGIYALKREALETVCEFKENVETEIWGPFFHENYFDIKELEIPAFLQANYRLTMDMESDYLMLSKVYSRLNICNNKIVELNTIIEFLDNNPEIAKINSEVVQSSVPKSIIKKIRDEFVNNESKFYDIKKKYYK